MEDTATTPVSAPRAQTDERTDGPVLTLTAAAITRVRAVSLEQGFIDHHLSIRVVPSGCSGLGYDVNLLKDVKKGDLTWEQDGIKIATDPMSAQYLTGTEVDYVKTDTAEGFRFANPNAKSSCGCGSSFSA